MTGRLNSVIASQDKMASWFAGTLSPNPKIETAGFSAGDNALRMVAIPVVWTPIWKQGNRVNAGTISFGADAGWKPASSKKAKILLWVISATAAGLAAMQENTGSMATPVWISRFEHRFSTDGGWAINAPEQTFGPLGDGTGMAARLEILTLTGTAYGTMHGLEV